MKGAETGSDCKHNHVPVLGSKSVSVCVFLYVCVCVLVCVCAYFIGPSTVYRTPVQI